MFKIMGSSNDLSSTFGTIVDSLMASMTHKMSLVTLEHLVVPGESFITNWALGCGNSASQVRNLSETIKNEWIHLIF